MLFIFLSLDYLPQYSFSSFINLYEYLIISFLCIDEKILFCNYVSFSLTIRLWMKS